MNVASHRRRAQEHEGASGCGGGGGGGRARGGRFLWRDHADDNDKAKGLVLVASERGRGLMIYVCDVMEYSKFN